MDYAKAYQTFIDEELAAASATEWMAAQSGQVRLLGGSEIELSSLSTTGLGDYDTSKTDGSAFPTGAVSSEWTTHTLTMDRGVKFALDRTDPSDSGFVATAENVIREFARVQLTREQDTYRINKLYTLAAGGPWADNHVIPLDPEQENAMQALTQLAQTLENDSEQTGGYVALISSTLKNAFLQAVDQSYNKVSFEQQVEINGVMYDHVMMVNDLPCLFVPQSRMATMVTVRSGRDNESMGGVVSAQNADDILMLIVSCHAPLAVSKIDSLKQFGPSENQLFDGTAIQARYLSDLFVPQNKIVTIGAAVRVSLEG
jgi:hypothetical protein